ncbi:MAG: immunoglobulin domain-containing protein [Ignavibacteria bacterium]|nr:immunoglobulin domain-containing protein [Ignavibacteria bacterium]
MSRFQLLTLRVLVLGGILFTSFQSVRAHSTGHFGGYQNGCGGGGCHGQSAQTTLTLNGPANVNPGTTADFSFIIAHPTNGYGGYNLSIRSATGAVGTLTAGAGSQVAGGEIAHNASKQAVAGQVTFSFQWTAPAQHGTYTVYGAGAAVDNDNTAAGDAYNTMSASVTVPGATITSPSPAVSFCTGAVMTINWTQTAIANVRIELSSNDFANITIISNSTPGANGTFAYTIPVTIPAATTYAVRLVNTANNAELARVSNLIITGAPSIVLQPLSQAVCQGASVTLTVGASGSSITYSWRKNGNVIAGATSAMYTISSMTQADAASYDCQVTGCSQTVITNAAVLTMTAKPAITKQPTPKTVCENQSVTFSVTATGDGLNYTWLRDGSPIPGASGATYTIPAVSISDKGVYRVRVSGTCAPQALSDTVLLTVVQSPIITIQPLSKTLSVGDTLKLSVTVVGDNLSYQWQRNGVSISGATTREYVKSGVARSDSGLYRCLVYNTCDTVNSSNAIVKVGTGVAPGELVLSTEMFHIGLVYACTIVDTTIAGLLINNGGLPVEITSYSTNPAGAVTIVGLATPVSIPGGSAVDVRLQIDPSQIGAGATVTFTTAGGNDSLVIMGTAISPIVFTEDTLLFTGPIDESMCAISIPMPCSAATITELSISQGSVTFEIGEQPVLPFTVTNGNTFRICIRTTDNQNATGQLVVKSSEGDGTVQLLRTPTTSVEEGNAIAGLTIAPNPANDYVIISAEGMNLNVQILDIAGRSIAALKGNGLIRWELQDSSGRRVAPGLYVVVVEEGSNRDVTKVLLY